MTSTPERHRTRSSAVRRWRRTALPGRFVAIDADLLGYCPRCHRFLFVQEDYRDTDRDRKKPAWMTQTLAWRLGIPALLIAYTETDAGDLARLQAHRLPTTPDGYSVLIGDSVDLIAWEMRVRDAHEAVCNGTPLMFRSNEGDR